MQVIADKTEVGLSDEAWKVLSDLKEHKVFEEMLDGYRMGVAHAIATGEIVPAVTKRRNMFHVGSLDPDHALRDVVIELYPEAADAPYSTIERLAEAGVKEIGRLWQDDRMNFGEICKLALQAGVPPVRDVE